MCIYRKNNRTFDLISLPYLTLFKTKNIPKIVSYIYFTEDRVKSTWYHGFRAWSEPGSEKCLLGVVYLREQVVLVIFRFTFGGFRTPSLRSFKKVRSFLILIKKKKNDNLSPRRTCFLRNQI